MEKKQVAIKKLISNGHTEGERKMNTIIDISLYSVNCCYKADFMPSHILGKVKLIQLNIEVITVIHLPPLHEIKKTEKGL